MKPALRRRTVHAALPIVALSAGWTASAAALPTVPPPPITLPTLSVPALSVPAVTTPVATTPAVTTPAATTPALPAPAPRSTVPDVQPPPPQARGVSGNQGVTRSADEGGQGRAETSREQASRLRLARDRRSAARPERTLLLIALRGPGLVELAIRRVAPDCRLIARYRLRGHRGLNRLRLRRLRPGTYVAVARSVPRGHVVGRARLVVSDRDGRVRTSRTADACELGASAEHASSTARPPTEPPRTPGSTKPQRTAHHRGVLGTRFGQALLSGADGVPIWVYGLLALAVGLLAAAAALPKGESRGLSASLLAGSVGAAILLALTIVFSLG
jgi:hypothetical protein